MTSKTWSLLNDKVKYYDMAAVALNDSQVLITCINASHKSEIYEPYSTTKKIKKIAGRSDESRFYHSVVTLNGYVYMIAGVAGDDAMNLDSVERISTDNLLINRGRWEDVPSMWGTRFGHMGAAVDGAIYVFGGKSGSNNDLSTGESFSPATEKWTTLPNMAMAKSNAGIAVVGRKIYLIGGERKTSRRAVQSVEVFNLDTSSWEIAPDIPLALSHTSATTVGNYIVVAGGVTGYERTNKTYIFNTKTNEWLEGKRDLALKRTNHSLVYLQKTKELFAIGGTDFMEGNGKSIEKVHFGTLLGVHKWDYLRLRLLVMKNRATSLIMKEKNKAIINATSPPKKKRRADTRDEKDLKIVTQFITDSSDNIFQYTLSFLY